MSRLLVQGSFNCNSCGKDLCKLLPVTISSDGIMSLDSECLKEYQTCPTCKSSVSAYIESTGTQFASGRSLITEVRELRQAIIQLKYELNQTNALIALEKIDSRKLLEAIETRLASLEDDMTSLRLWVNE